MILTDISLKRPVFATVTLLALIVLGLVSYLSLNVDEWPSVEFPYVTVQVIYPGAPPEQVESKVIQKVEEAVGAVSGVKHIYSTAREGVALVTVEFQLDVAPETAAQNVRDKLGMIRSELPQDSEEPVVMRFDPADMPIVSLTLTGDKSLRELTALVEHTVKRRLESVNGVGTVNVRGAAEREIQLELHADRLQTYGLTLQEVTDTLKQANVDAPGGRLEQGGKSINLRTAGNYSRASDFLQVSVGRRGGQELYFSQIGQVQDGVKDPTDLAMVNDKPAVGLDIIKQSGSNTIVVVEQIEQVVKELQNTLPPGVELRMVRDNSLNIRHSINDVLFNLVVGGLLAVAIVFLFLGNWRSTIIAGIAIPASIISSFFLMKIMDFSLNSMSLMGLSLAVGLLIDDAIVVIENIVRHMEGGKDKNTAAAEGTSEIGLAVTATTFTLVAVFVPVGLMGGIVGQFFRQFGLTVAFAVLVSLVIAFTLTPLLSARYLQVGHERQRGKLAFVLDKFEMFFSKFTENYGKLLAWALGHRKRTLGVAGLFFVGSLALMPFLGSEFIQATDKGEFVVTAELDAGLSVEGASEKAAKLSQIIRQEPEVVLTYSVASADQVQIFTKLTDKQERSRSNVQIMNELRGRLNQLPGIQASMNNVGTFMVRKPVNLAISGDDLHTLDELALKVRKLVEDIPGTEDVQADNKQGKPDLRLVPKQSRMADAGVSAAAVADTVHTLVQGKVVGQFRDGEDRYDVRLRLVPDERGKIQDLNRVFLPGKVGADGRPRLLPLRQLVEEEYGTSPVEIHRQDRERAVTVTANLNRLSLGEFNEQLAKKLQELDMPAGYHVKSQGESEEMRESFSSIGMALLLSVLFIFFVLAAQFESYIDPFAIMFSLPLALIGAVLGLLVMNSKISMISLIGVIMLMGLVTKNAILLVDFAKRGMAEGMEVKEALQEAARERIRPIMMTTAAMIFGMLPMAVGIGPGAEARAPMAYAIIGGLVTSTLLTLVVVPVLYSLLQDAKAKASRRHQ